ncbi:probable protein phosphatase 2C 7 isoform X2 [Miscanthus floridulus]|uniref:probable protein phosphatase 2C 7 isoform X2 n=1 Tax=Miscanthus floridulus TaxID=154761 RepID=UPI0034581F0D
MACDGGVKEQEGPSAASAAPSPAAVARARARAARPPRPRSRKGLGARHPLKPYRILAALQRANARVREAGEATLVAALAAAQKESERENEVVPDVCGGWKSEDGSLNCGYSSTRGHGGTRAAGYLKQHLFENLLKHPAFVGDTKSAMSESYKKTDADFLDAEGNIQVGSTASTAVLIGNHLYVANVGDSRAVMSKAGKAIALSDDHKPNRSDEQKRIEDAGGVVVWSGTWRVAGILAMSRAFGNRLLKQFVVAHPEIQDLEIDGDVEFLILASDGLWDVVPNEHAVAFVKDKDSPEAAARKLTEIAFRRGSTDNITCIVVEFCHDKMVDGSLPSTNQS